jgi:hypothetical protein
VGLMRAKLGFLSVAVAANVLAIGAVNVRSAHARSCAGGSSLDKQIRTSAAVFSGEVVEIEADERAPGVGPPLGRVTFDVKGSWKGASEESVAVYGYGDEISCGIEFEEGESHLVYATRSNGDEDGPLETNFCDPTKPLEYADGDLLVLGPSSVPMPDTGGSVFSPATGAAVIVAFASLSLAGGVLAVGRVRRAGSHAGRG